MPTIKLSQETYNRFKSHAIPLEDSSDTLMIRLLDSYEKSKDLTGQPESPVTVYSPDDLPPLMHAKLLDASFSGTRPKETNWNALVRHAISIVLPYTGNIENLRNISDANIVPYEKRGKGFIYDKEYGLSIQGQSASDAAAIVSRCAKYLGCEAHFEFEWMHNDGAYKPGARGRVEFFKTID